MRNKNLLVLIICIMATTGILVASVIGLEALLIEVLHLRTFHEFYWDATCSGYLAEEAVRLSPYATILSLGMNVYCYIQVRKEER